MKKVLSLTLFLFMVLPAFAQQTIMNNTGVLSGREELVVVDNNGTENATNVRAVVSSEFDPVQLQDRIRTAVQYMNGTTVVINESVVNISQNEIQVRTEIQNRIEIGERNVVVESVDVSSDNIPVQIQTRIVLSEGDIVDINVYQNGTDTILYQERVTARVYMEGEDSLVFNNGMMYVNISGDQRQIRAPEQAMERVVVTNESRVEMALRMVENAPMYQVREERTVRLFGLIPLEMNITTNVNAETGNIRDIEKPWWSFFASGD